MATALFKRYASNDHFTVDGTLIQSWALLKSFRPKDEPRDKGLSEDGRNRPVISPGQRRKNQTHRSTTDPGARLAPKSDSRPALLSHSGHALVENRHGLCLDNAVAETNGHAERFTAEKLLRHFRRRQGVKPKTVSADRGYEAEEFLRTLEEDLSITPQVPITRERVASPGPAAETRRRMLRRMKTKGYTLGQWAQENRADVRMYETAGRLAQGATGGPLEDSAGGLLVGLGVQLTPLGPPRSDRINESWRRTHRGTGT